MFKQLYYSGARSLVGENIQNKLKKEFT